MNEDILKKLQIPEKLEIDVSGLPRGINNYHIDIRISKKFASDLKVMITELLRREGEQKNAGLDREKIGIPLRKSYLDMMSVLIHRVKTDLAIRELEALQFAVPRYVLETVTRSLNSHIVALKKHFSDLQAKNSVQVLEVHKELAWLNKHYNSILYRINKHIFSNLLRVESQQLKSLRKQYMGESRLDFAELLANPLLLTFDLNLPQLLIENYTVWGNFSVQSEFPALNQALEKTLSATFPQLETTPLKNTSAENQALEIYDDLRGLKGVKPFLGSSTAIGDNIQEAFCWLEQPDNIEKLFNLEYLREYVARVRQEQGYKAWFVCKRQVDSLEKVIRNFFRPYMQSGQFTIFAASYQTRKTWAYNFQEGIDIRLLCQFLAGQINLHKLQDPALGGQKLSEEEQLLLTETAQNIARYKDVNDGDTACQVLKDISRYRLHLKQARFTHLLFNRLKVLTTEADIQLSKQAGTLYQLHTSAEVEEEESREVHHTILKADVRGSTTVTAMLEQKKLNPASYFSLHFFGPINEIFPLYGGKKVFIEGDAIIVSFLEYGHNPQEWYAVARACGFARALLNIVRENNEHARKTGLPLLELGIGICFAPEPARYLYDGDQAIMISSAIGRADRLSSCSWMLRDKLKDSFFNVDVLEEKGSSSDKGETFLRFNLNGILLENAGFEKLQKEVAFKKLKTRLNGEPITLYYAIYPDAAGNRRDLVIREGYAGVWENAAISQAERPETPERAYYEVVTGGKLISLVRNALHGKS